MTGVIATIPRYQFSSALGVPLVGGKLYTYLAGTTTPVATYQDQDLSVKNENPIKLDATGSCTIWLDPTKQYKFVLKSALGTTQPGWPIDNISGASNLVSLQPTLGLYAKLSALAAVLGSALVGFIQTGVGAVLRTVQDELRDRISVKQFGAKGDGAADDTAAITKADAEAAKQGKDLFFPAGTYMADPLMATTSWRGELGSVIKYRGMANVDLVTATGVDNIVFADLAFEGNVSADPGAWSAANYDSFTGASGLTVGDCDGAKIIRCRAKNTRAHGFRLLSTTNASFDSCSTKRSRGKNGDGFYMNSTIGTTVRDCRAYDFTRIGFVADTFGNDPKTTHNLHFEGCMSEYGHDCSILYGSTEYNAGAWFENSAHVNVSNFTAKNISTGFSRGLVLCSGVKNNGVVGDTATFNVNNVTFENTGVGLTAYSLASFPVAVNVTDLKAYKVYNGVNFVAKNPTDSFVCDSSFVDVDFTINPQVTAAYSYGVFPDMPTKPVIQFLDCQVAHTNEDPTKLAAYGTGTSVTDVGPYTGDPVNNGARITVRNIVNPAGGPVWINNPYRHAHDIEVIDTYFRAPYANELWTGSFVARDCRIHSANIGESTSAKTELYDCTIEGNVHVGGTTVRLDGGRVLLSGTDFVWLFSSALDKRPAIVVANTMFEKDVAAGGKFLRIGFGGNFKCTALFSDVQFYNTSGATTDNPCLMYSSGTGVLLASNVYKDSTITYVYSLDNGTNLGAALPGVTNATFH